MSLQSQLDTVNSPAWLLYFLQYHTPQYETYEECFESHMGAGIAYHQTGPWFNKQGPWMETEDIAIKAHKLAKDDFEYDQQEGALEVMHVAMDRKTQDKMIADTEAGENFVRWT